MPAIFMIVPQLTARGFFVEVDHPVAGKAKYAGMGPKLSEDEFQVRRPAPLLGQHNVENILPGAGLFFPRDGESAGNRRHMTRAL